MATAEVCRRHGVSEQTIHRWRGQMQREERLGRPEAEGARRMIAGPGGAGQTGAFRRACPTGANLRSYTSALNSLPGQSVRRQPLPGSV